MFAPEDKAEMPTPKEEAGQPKVLAPKKVGRTGGQAWPAEDAHAGGQRRPAACVAPEDEAGRQEVVAREEDAGRPEVVVPEEGQSRQAEGARAGQWLRKNIALKRLLLRHWRKGKGQAWTAREHRVWHRDKKTIKQQNSPSTPAAPDGSR